MKKMLIAIDGSKGALRAVEYVGDQFGGMGDLQITLYHVSRGVPPQFWDDGHILNETEKGARQAVLDTWQANQKIMLEATFRKAVETLTGKGISPRQIETKSTWELAADVADCILTEARNDGYQTLVIGRCGHSSTAHFLLGSIAGRVINRGAGLTICVVG